MNRPAAPAAGTGIVDSLCNSFLPERERMWDEPIRRQGVPVKLRREPDDTFVDPDGMVARMDEVGVETLLLVTGDPHGSHGAFNFSELTATYDELAGLAAAHPGRFRGLWNIDPTAGIDGVRRVEEVLATDLVVGMYLHVHSFDRPFDHADLYPFYTVASQARVPVAMQAGTSGGRHPSACGQPIGIDRPAIYFPDTDFVLSHLGWPWTAEAIAMALKFSNVFLGTGAYPPRHWGPDIVAFLKGPGREKVMYGTNFPTVGHRKSLAQLEELELAPTTRANLLGGTARRVFTRLPASPPAG